MHRSMAREKAGWMINGNDLVYCRNSSLQVLTINSHTHHPLSVCFLVFFASLFVCSSMGFFTYKEGLESICFSKKYFLFVLATSYFILDDSVHFCGFFSPEFHVFLLWYPWLLLVVGCVWALCKGFWPWRYKIQVQHKASYFFSLISLPKMETRVVIWG